MTHGLRILIVDDNKDLADGLALVLEFSGHQLWVAYDALQGIRKAAEVMPHAILHDITLPGLCGYDAARLIRQDVALQSVVLIAVTAYGTPADIQCAKDAGFDHHCQKPVDMAKLDKILATISATAQPVACA